MSCQGVNGEDSVDYAGPASFFVTAAKVGGVSFRPGSQSGFIGTVGYAFQTTLPNSYQRVVYTTFNGSGGPGSTDLAAAGSVDLPFNWGCLPAGVYPVTVTASACSYFGTDPDKTHSVNTSVKIPFVDPPGASIRLAARYEPSTRSVYFSGTQTLPPGITYGERVIRRLRTFDEQGNVIRLARGNVGIVREHRSRSITHRRAYLPVRSNHQLLQRSCGLGRDRRL